MEYPKRLTFTSRYQRYKIFLVSPSDKEIDGKLVRTKGKQLEFEPDGHGNGVCICDDPETIRLALESGYYGREYISSEWEKMRMSETDSEDQNSDETAASEGS